MNGPDVLACAPTPFEHAGKTYHLARPDHELELLFQARHEAWARNRIEATAALVGEKAYRADLESFGTRRDANRFAFGSPLSMAFLLSDDGMAEYVLLLSQKGQKEGGGALFGKAQLVKLRRQDEPEWERLTDAVVRRDFPNLLPATAPPSRPPETPASTTNGSSSSSAAGPGTEPAERSCP